MYISKLFLNYAKDKACKCKDTPYLLHGYFANKSFNKQRILWRMEDDFILVLHDNIEDFSDFTNQFGFEDDNTKCLTKDYTNILSEVSNNQQYIFRVKGHPVKKSDGKEISLLKTDDRMNWFLKQGSQNGFQVTEMCITDNKPIIFKKNTNDKVTLNSVIYTGTLTVTDEIAFKNALINGIGRKKTFGFGLLSVLPTKKTI